MSDNNSPGVVVCRRDFPTVEHAGATGFATDDRGALIVTGENGRLIAMHAPGEWSYATRWGSADA